MHLRFKSFRRLALAITTIASLASSMAAPFHTAEFATLGCPNSTSPIATISEQHAAISDFAQQLFISKSFSSAFSTYVARDLINHAPAVPGDGRAIAQQIVSPALQASEIEIQWVTVGQDHANIFLKLTSSQGVVASAETFRMAGTCLVEHWIVLTAVEKSSNPHPYF